MSVFTNKHVVIALIVSPILAVITYLLVDRMVRPEALKAEPGDTYPLVARSNCRYASGKCTLYNGDFRIDLTQLESDSEPYTIMVESDYAISGLRYAAIDKEGVEIKAGQLTGETFRLPAQQLKDMGELRIALQSSGVMYFAETQVTFLK